MDGSVVIEAVLDISKVEKGVKDVKSTLGSVSWKGIKEGDAAAQKLSGSLKTAGAAATVGLTAPIVAAGAAAFGTAANYEQATARIRSALGLTADEAERLGDVGEGIYENGFGSSLDAVDDALITVRQNLGELSDADLTYVTQAALTLSDTLGMDVGESVRGVDALVSGFGLSATEAMDLFTAGAQNGLNYSDELGDNLAEYGPRFAQMGFSASEYFSILQAGADNGAYSLDKVNDFLNEFQTSLSDGRMDEQIGRFSESTQQLFQSWKEGGATGQQVFEAVMGELAQMPDGYEKANVASALWSSLGEDNAMGMISSLAGVEDSYGDVAGAAQEAADTASDSFAGKAQSAMRELQGAIEPLGQPLLDIATWVADGIRSFGEWFAGIGEGGQRAVIVLGGVLAAAGPVLSVAGTLVDTLPKIGKAMSGLTGSTGALGKAMSVLAGPVGIVVAAVAAIAAAFVWAYNNVEPFREAVDGLVAFLQETFGPVIEEAGTFLNESFVAAFTWLAQVITETVIPNLQLLAQWFAENVLPVVQEFGEFLTTYVVPALAQLASWVMETVLPALADLWSWFSANILPVLQSFWGFVSANILPLLASLAEFIFGTVVPALAGIWSWVSSNILPALSSFWGFVSANILPILSTLAEFIFGTVIPALSDLWSWFSANILPVLQDVWGAVEDGIETFRKFADDVGTFIGNAKRTISDGLEAISGFFSGLRIELPHINLPHFTISGEFSLMPPSVPSIGVEWYAKGGIFNGASVIGVGEAGPEAVVPLNKRGVMPLAEGLAEELHATGGGDSETAEAVRRLIRELPSIIRKNSARTIVWNKREVARLVWEVMQ